MNVNTENERKLEQDELAEVTQKKSTFSLPSVKVSNTGWILIAGIAVLFMYIFAPDSFPEQIINVAMGLIWGIVIIRFLWNQSIS
jgi:hypothetical protein